MAAMALPMSIRAYSRYSLLWNLVSGSPSLSASLASVIGTEVHARMPLMPSGLLYAERFFSVFGPKLRRARPDRLGQVGVDRDARVVDVGPVIERRGDQGERPGDDPRRHRGAPLVVDDVRVGVDRAEVRGGLVHEQAELAPEGGDVERRGGEVGGDVPVRRGQDPVGEELGIAGGQGHQILEGRIVAAEVDERLEEERRADGTRVDPDPGIGRQARRRPSCRGTGSNPSPRRPR